MQNGAAAPGVEEQVFRPAPDGGYGLPFEPRLEVVGHRPSERPVPDSYIAYDATRHVRLDTATTGLYFREFGHPYRLRRGGMKCTPRRHCTKKARDERAFFSTARENRYLIFASL